MFLLWCPHSDALEQSHSQLLWDEATASSSYSWRRKQSQPQLWHSQQASGWRAQLQGHKWQWGEGHRELCSAVMDSNSCSAWRVPFKCLPFLLTFVASLTAPMAKKAPMGPHPPKLPWQQKLKSISFLDVFFTVITQHWSTPSFRHTGAQAAQLQGWFLTKALALGAGTQSWITGVNSWKQMFNTGLGISPILLFKVSFCMLSMVKTPNWRFQFYWKPPSYSSSQIREVFCFNNWITISGKCLLE